jgi:hypothetical protein
VQTLPFITIREHRHRAGAFEAHDTPLAMLVDREAAFAIEGEPVRSRLVILTDVYTGVAAFAR